MFEQVLLVKKSDPLLLKSHPAFQYQQTVIPLSGFSGTYVGLIVGFGSADKFVRKASVTPNDNTRLESQARLQKALASSLGHVFKMPQVLQEGYSGQCYWYDMEYVSGVDAIEYLAPGGRRRVSRFVNKVEEVWQALASSGSINSNKKEIDLSGSIKAKLDEIDKKTHGKFTGLIESIRTQLGSATIKLDETLAHGDFTLENILFDRNEKLWLIDATPSPMAHYWTDISKLFQDVEGRWFINRKRKLSLGVSCALSDTLKKNLSRSEPGYLDFHPVLLSLSFARILPYCFSDGDIDFVRRRIHSIIRTSKLN